MVESHRAIKDRLLATAATAWGLPGGRTEESFDPLVGLLFGACATELEKISHDIADTRARTLERIVSLLYPEVLARAIPAHAVAYAYPSEKNVMLESDAQFYYQKRVEAPSDGAPASWKNIFFSPTANFKLHQANIKLMAGTGALYNLEEGLTKSLISISRQGNAFHKMQNSLWLGVENLQNITGEASFYFDLKIEAGKNIFYDYLHFAKWYLGDRELKHLRNFGKSLSISYKPDPEEIINGQTNTSNRILRNINQLYAERYISVEIPANLPPAEKIPKELEDLYRENDITKFGGGPLHWIRIDMPENIEVNKIFNDIFISLNCIPLVNRHLIINQQKLMEHVNIIPLNSDENFLDISDITDIKGTSLNSNGGDNEAIYLHFGGVERFTEKSALAAIEGLIQQLRDESISFSNIGNDFLNTELRSLQQNLNKLEQQVVDKQILTGDTPYILIPDRDKAATSNIYIKYWTTNGEDANSIKSGSSLSLYKNADIQGNSVKLINNVQGGRNSLANSDKVLAYKSALLNKEKLVTEEDIAIFCKLRLGIKSAAVTVTKGFKVQENRKAGFIKTIDVTVTLQPQAKNALQQRGSLDIWEKDLAFAITDKSNFFMPVRAFIK